MSDLVYNWSIVSKQEKEVASTEVITANLSLKATDASAAGLTVLEGLAGADGHAYLTNPSAPTADSNEDNDPDWKQTPPTTAVSNNATLVTYTDGTMALKVPVKNAVFTLQKLGTSEQVAAEDIVLTTREGKYGTNTSCIDSITIPVTEKTGSVVFKDCEVYPTLLMTGYTVPLTLTWGTEAVQEKTSISNVTVTGIADATYTGKAITQPNLKVTLGGGVVTLTEGTDYTVTYTDNTNVGTATITITGMGNYTGTITKTFEIKAPETETETPATETETPTTETETPATETETPATETETPETETPAAKKAAAPKGKSLKYNGKEQTGVTEGEGYTLTGNKAVNAGSYKATAVLKKGYIWSDGTTGNKTISWSIARVSQKITVKKASANFQAVSIQKKAASFSIGAAADGKLTYKVTKAPSGARKYITVDKNGKVTIKKGAVAGTYKVRISAAQTAGKKAATKDITIKVKKSSQKIQTKFTAKTVKASTLKEKAVILQINGKAEGKLSYKVVSAPKKGTEYITVSKKGKVTVKKNAPKGTYKIKITAKKTAAYKEAVKTIKVVVK